MTLKNVRSMGQVSRADDRWARLRGWVERFFLEVGQITRRNIAGTKRASTRKHLMCAHAELIWKGHATEQITIKIISLVVQGHGLFQFPSRNSHRSKFTCPLHVKARYTCTPVNCIVFRIVVFLYSLLSRGLWNRANNGTFSTFGLVPQDIKYSRKGTETCYLTASPRMSFD